MAQTDPPRIKATAGVTDEIILTWAEGPYAGLRVVCQPDVSLGLALIFNREAPTVEEQAARFARFGTEVLRDWNLDDDKGTPIPANGEGMTSIPSSLAWMIVRKFGNVTGGVDDPLDSPSLPANTEDDSPPKSQKPGSTSASRNGSGSRRTR